MSIVAVFTAIFYFIPFNEPAWQALISNMGARNNARRTGKGRGSSLPLAPFFFCTQITYKHVLRRPSLHWAFLSSKNVHFKDEFENMTFIWIGIETFPYQRLSIYLAFKTDVWGNLKVGKTIQCFFYRSPGYLNSPR